MEIHQMVAHELNHEHLNSDEAIQKRSSRRDFRTCTECGHMVGVGYMGYVFTECPVCSGSLEEVES